MRAPKFAETSTAATAYSPLQSDRIRSGVKGEIKSMAQTIGTIIFVILALVVLSALLNLLFGVLGFAFALIKLLLPLAIIGGIIYLGWVVFCKLTRTTES